MRSMRKVLVTGGAGFVGSHLAEYYLKGGVEVTILDNLSRVGVEYNMEHLRRNYPRVRFVKADVRDFNAVKKAVRGSDLICHCAAQVAVTTSVSRPREDFEINALGTINVLEAMRQAADDAVLNFTSCYDEKTRALTREGLKTYNEIKSGDEVLSINPETRKLEYKEVTDVIVQNYDGKMIKFGGKRVNLCVTPNHRMLVYKAGWRSLKFERADKVISSTTRIMPVGEWDGKEEEFVRIDQSDLPWNANKVPRNFPTDDLFYLIGIYIGDGSCQSQVRRIKSKTGLSRGEYIKRGRSPKTGVFVPIGRVGAEDWVESKSHVIFFHIPVGGRARKRVEETLNRNRIKWHNAWSKSRGDWGIFFSSKALYSIFKECGTQAHEKRIPKWVLEYSGKHLECLYRGLMDSDGCYVARHNPQYTTSSEYLLRDLIELGVKIGRNVCFHYYRSKAEIEGREIRGGAYYVIFSRPKRGLYGKNAKEVDYNGKVWCVKVKDNENLLVERNGKIAFSGNTNKLYGENVNEIPLKELDTRYDFADPRYAKGIPEDFPIDAVGHSPYGVCLGGRTHVITKDGFKPIRYIRPQKDMVLSKDGKWHRVLRVLKRRPTVEDRVKLFKPSRGPPFLVTDNHPILLSNGWMEVSRIREYRPGRLNLSEIMEPKPLIEDVEVPQILEFQYRGYRSRINCDESFWRLIGFWLAEGTLGKAAGIFADPGIIRIFQKDRKTLNKYLEKCREIDPEVKVRVSKGLYTMEFWHPGLWRWLRENFKVTPPSGKSKRYKTVPLWLASLPQKYFEMFWDGWEEGDGLHASSPTVPPTIGTSSRYLAGRMYLVMRARGMNVSVSLFKPPKGKTHYKIARLRSNYQNNAHIKQARIRCDRRRRFYLYDLEVKDEDSYALPGCVVHNSKLAADQYVRDYCATYGLKTVTFRMSCIFGTRQFGTEDQGWLAHFIISATLGRPLTIYGDGKQVRDVLYVNDLIRAFDTASANVGRTKGQAYNIGGGKANTTSLLELIDQLEKLLGRKIKCSFDEWRPADQKVYYSDVAKAKRDFGWKPEISKREGVKRLLGWVKENERLF